MEVECDYEVLTVNNVTAWRGEFAKASANEPEPGEAELCLGSKVGQIIINQVFVGAGRGWFEGTGPPPG